MPSPNNEAAFNLKDVSAFQNGLRFLRLLWRESPLFSAALAAATVIRGLIPVVELWLMGRLVDQLSTVLGSETSPDLTPVYTTAVLLVGLMMSRNWVRHLAEGIEDYLRDRVGARLQQGVIEKAYRVELSFFERESSYDELQRANASLGSRLVNIYTDTLDVCRGTATSVGYVVVLMTGHWLLGPLVLATAIPSLYLKVTRARQRYIFDYDTLTPTRRRLAYFSRLLSDKVFSKEVRLFGLFDHLIRRWQEQQRRWTRDSLSEVARETKTAFVTDCILNVAFAAAALILAAVVVGGQMTIGLYVMLTRVTTQLQ